MASSVYIFQDGVFNVQQLELTDECGDTNTISGHVALMVPFYYFPLALVLMVCIVKLVPSIREYYRRKSTKYR